MELLLSLTLFKRVSNTGVLLLRNFKNTYFEEHLRTDASELTLESDCLELCFWTVAFKTILNWKCYKNTNRFQTRSLETQLGANIVFVFNPYASF